MIVHWLMIGAAAFFAVWENAYFGHNLFPQSDAELIADGLVLLMVILANLVGVLVKLREALKANSHMVAQSIRFGAYPSSRST